MTSASHQSLCCWDILYSYHSSSLLVPRQLTWFPVARAVSAGAPIISALHHHLPYPYDAIVFLTIPLSSLSSSQLSCYGGSEGGTRGEEKEEVGCLVWLSLGREQLLSWTCSHIFPVMFQPWTPSISHSYCPHTLPVPAAGQFSKVIGLIQFWVFIMTYFYPQLS